MISLISTTSCFFFCYLDKEEKIIIDNNFEKQSFSGITKDAEKLSWIQTSSLGLTQDIVKINSKIDTYKADKYCIIRGMVYENIIEEFNAFENIFKNKIRTYISNLKKL